MPNAILHLFCCPPFLNYSWRSEAFKYNSRWSSLAQHDAWRQYILKQINTGLSEEAPVRLGCVTHMFLSHACDRINEYVEFLKTHHAAVMDLGLCPGSRGPPQRSYGYGLGAGLGAGEERTRFWQAFLLCILIDRISWAHGLCSGTRPTPAPATEVTVCQHRHPLTNCLGLEPLDNSSAFERCQKVEDFFKTCQENIPVIFPAEDEVVFRTQLTLVSGKTHQVSSWIYAVSSNLFFMANIALILSQVGYSLGHLVTQV